MTRDRPCVECRYWSQMIAQSIGPGPIEAWCLSQTQKQRFRRADDTCDDWAKNSHGAVDEPPDYGETANEKYRIEAARKYPNGAPMFDKHGMMLDDQGNRSIFDDVEE